MIRKLAVVVIILGIIGILLGGVFLWQGASKYFLIVDRMNVEKVTLAVDPNSPQQVTTVNSAASAEAVADKIAIDRRKIAPTYQDLLKQSNGRFDPTIPQEISYAQAMNLENYLYMAVTAFGLTESVAGSGAYMILTGAAVLMIGLAFRRLGRDSI
jgi:hypothetical protein